jgi:outer membrane protein
MNNPKQKTSLIISFLAIALVVGYAIYNQFNTKRVAYVKTAIVFNDFKMKKALEAEYKKVENLRKVQLDSMMLVLNMIHKEKDFKGKNEFLDYKTQEYKAKQQEFEESNIALTEKYNEQIWNQLNQYIKDFGDKNNYDFIYGSSGDGNLMYAADRNDITQDVTNYVNVKYEGLSN